MLLLAIASVAAIQATIGAELVVRARVGNLCTLSTSPRAPTQARPTLATLAGPGAVICQCLPRVPSTPPQSPQTSTAEPPPPDAGGCEGKLSAPSVRVETREGMTVFEF